MIDFGAVTLQYLNAMSEDQTARTIGGKAAE